MSDRGVRRVELLGLPGGGGGRSGWDFYLVGANNSVVGRGDAAGTSFERFNYTDVGSWSGYDLQPALLRHDADEDGDIDGADWVSFQNCFATTDAACLLAHDFDVAGASDGAIDLDDWAGFEECFSGPDTVPGFACSTGRLANTPPASDQFGLHGRPVDVLPDGKVLMYVRARFYDPEHARWLQRDPTGYTDGNNLYEAFGANATRFTDPMGLEVMEFGGPLEDSCGLLGYGSGLASRAAGWSNNDLIDTLGAALQVAHLANTAGNQAAALDAEARVKVLKAELQARAAELKGTARSGFRERQLAVNPNAARDPLMAIYEYRDQEMEAQLLSTAEALIATINEPADWALTARDMYNNGFSPWQLASFLPLVSGGSVKAAAKVAEVGQAARAANNANDLARVLDLGGYSGKQAERISDAAKGTTRAIANKAGKAYPDVIDPRTGKAIGFPEGNLSKVPKGDRVSWGHQERGDYIAEWHRRGHPEPAGGWSEYDIHHIKPREYGGSNAFDNLVPVQRATHQDEFNAFWRDY